MRASSEDVDGASAPVTVDRASELDDSVEYLRKWYTKERGSTGVSRETWGQETRSIGVSTCILHEEASIDPALEQDNLIEYLEKWYTKERGSIGVSRET